MPSLEKPAIKFLHASDLHLGSHQYRNPSRSYDYINILKEILAVGTKNSKLLTDVLTTENAALAGIVAAKIDAAEATDALSDAEKKQATQSEELSTDELKVITELKEARAKETEERIALI